VWPYIALAIVLLPPGLLGVVVPLSLGLDGLPGAVAAGVLALGVLVVATYNIVLVRRLRSSCCRRRSRGAVA
jgi:hypothetical protein